MKINYLLLFGTILCSCARVDDHPGVSGHIVSHFLNVSFNSLDPVGGGVINANIDEFWEEEDVEVKRASSLWD